MGEGLTVGAGLEGMRGCAGAGGAWTRGGGGGNTS